MCAMEEDGTSAPRAARMKVVIEHDYDVVEPIVAPHVFVPAGTRQADRPVVGGPARLVAPAVARAQRTQEHRRTGTRQAIRPEKAADEFQSSDRGGTVAFALAVPDAASANRTRDDEMSCHQSPAPVRFAATAGGARHGAQAAQLLGISLRIERTPVTPHGTGLQSCAILPMWSLRRAPVLPKDIYDAGSQDPHNG